MWVPFGVASFAGWAVAPFNRAGKGLGHDPWWTTPCAGEGDHKGRPCDVVVAGDAFGPSVDHHSQSPRGSGRRAPVDLETSADQGP